MMCTLTLFSRCDKEKHKGLSADVQQAIIGASHPIRTNYKTVNDEVLGCMENSLYESVLKINNNARLPPREKANLLVKSYSYLNYYVTECRTREVKVYRQLIEGKTMPCSVSSMPYYCHRCS